MLSPEVSANNHCWKLDTRLKRSLFLPPMAGLMVYFYMATGRQQLLSDFSACQSVWRYVEVFWPCAVKKENFKKFVKV